MNRDGAYLKDVVTLVEHIRTACPPDLADRFGRESGIDVECFSQCAAHMPERVVAVDGSNSMILESGMLAVAAIRAAVSGYRAGEREFLSATPIRLIRMGTEPEIADFEALYRECFSLPPHNGVRSEDRSKAAAVFRDTLEYAAATQALDRMEGGDVLLLDGSLRVSHESHRPVLNDILVKAGGMAIPVAGVSKQSSATWGGGLPLVLSVDRFAHKRGIRAPWYVSIPEDLLDRHQYDQWRRGRIFVARLHPRSPCAFKIEVPDYADDDAVDRTFRACAAYADDGRIPGYPFPLMDAHRTVCITEDVAERIRNDLIMGMNHLGLDWNDFQQLFGDYHDEFKRY